MPPPEVFVGAPLLAWASGTVAIVMGLGISFTFDLIRGPVLVCAFGVVLIVALAFRPWLGRRVRESEGRGLLVRSDLTTGRGDDPDRER